jgi:hypothetical protein
MKGYLRVRPRESGSRSNSNTGVAIEFPVWTLCGLSRPTRFAVVNLGCRYRLNFQQPLLIKKCQR